MFLRENPKAQQALPGLAAGHVHCRLLWGRKHRGNEAGGQVLFPSKGDRENRALPTFPTLAEAPIEPRPSPNLFCTLGSNSSQSRKEDGQDLGLFLLNPSADAE